MQLKQLLSPLLVLCLISPSLQAKGRGADSPTPTAQEQGQTPLEKAREARRKKQLTRPSSPQLTDSKGKPVLPGQLPAGTSPAAEKLWTQVLEKSGTGRTIRSFELHFALRQRHPEHPQSNDVDLDFRFLVPGYVRAELESGRTLLRGPRGDFLTVGAETIPLIGREGLEDVKQLDQMASLARNFVALSNPHGLRITKLVVLPEAPKQLPSRFKSELAKLTWLRIVSPDFFLHPDQPRTLGGPVELYSVALGVNEETHEIRFASLQEQRVKVEGEKRITSLIAATATLVSLTDYVERNGFHVPHKVQVFSVDPGHYPWRYASKPSSELYLRRKRGSLRAGLRPEDFNPTEQ